MTVAGVKSTDQSARLEEALDVLREERRRRGHHPLTVEQRERLIQPLTRAIHALERARGEPRLESRRFHWSGLSTGRRISIVSLGALALACVWQAMVVEQGARFVAILVALAATVGGILALSPYSEGIGVRREIRAARRLARRLAPGGRRTRAEAFGEPMVGPPAADAAAVALLCSGALVAWTFSPAAGAVIAFAPMAALLLALALRVRVHLSLPTHERGVRRWMSSAVAATVLGWVMLVPVNDVWPNRLLVMMLSLLLYYGSWVSLAEERTPFRSTWIERHVRPVVYWMSVTHLILFATALALVALLVSPAGVRW